MSGEKTCGNCRHFNWCTWAYQMKPDSTECDFIPSRWAAIEPDKPRVFLQNGNLIDPDQQNDL